MIGCSWICCSQEGEAGHSLIGRLLVGSLLLPAELSLGETLESIALQMALVCEFVFSGVTSCGSLEKEALIAPDEQVGTVHGGNLLIRSWESLLTSTFNAMH